MRIPPSAFLSVVLLLASVSAVSIPTVNVNVMNFPLDEQGNLKVSSQQKPTPVCKGSIGITLIQSPEMYSSGILVRNDTYNSVNHPLELPFSLDAKPSSIYANPTVIPEHEV